MTGLFCGETRTDAHPRCAVHRLSQPQALAASRQRKSAESWGISTKSRERIYGAQIQASAERAKKARKDADEYACIAWNNRMLGYKGPAQPSPTIGDALNAGFGYLEVRCLGCAPDRRAQHRPPPQADAGPRAGALPALQGLLAGSALSA